MLKAFLIVLVLCGGLVARAQDSQAQPGSQGSLKEVPLSGLSEDSLSKAGRAALAINPEQWKHSESRNFIYHYAHSFVAGPVSVEAEFYYSIIAKELGKDTSQWQRKCHVFIFEEDKDWVQFQKMMSLDPWTGGIHSGNDLFIQRDPSKKFKGDTLGHEIAHLVVHRFFGPGVPLWLNEGYAEYAAARGYAAFYRARGYNAKPKAAAVPPSAFIPLKELLSATSYPEDTAKVDVFYSQSERLVRYLSGLDKTKFLAFFEALSRGNRFDNALGSSFGTQLGLERLESDFKQYATKDHAAATQKN